ncbi:tRNA (guanosine(46)-N7)-methyltransferase TrmB [Metamycoplasma hyosynoviae]|uniref:tRNA (guanosine(46)-N7)-methyltransferase TrmB n=1 Tax=Metamycoplasma hyosynoviae TaxID=29559 RepID=UPI0020C84860|nr:tRNA (guanosine(46)-N7)-methyltransferase TrmB [Metamycoplasma hyosynoviae]MDC8921166.1 tRNA (guanosine(46)-N7)-methyltransferase TrmB [Metamycoplasma hyosynoviae]MDC8938091.1 tRNA (guanosine(46)-N7)-methyltransferase TrmB [Metamycoplasma hyosynoviae]MDD1358956.1 tRNA (guanosine(46)-N7)-methyltransferase TrmB [Metamycoplasma hyosynoviae]MDD1359582.1 tRNA (guanosine(46)-N7)-methyltransferase TrmB [Metamycoplasma hyosynoviae]MDD1361382.1 tRNA (guanosine(46)-N7)-methyltransferase TrmB [Metamyc
MRLRYNKNADEILKNSEYTITNFPFNVEENSILEIGMGKGKMITEMAFENPNNNYIGIEKYSTVALSAMKKASGLNLNNFKIMIGDAKNILELFNGKFNTIWLTFSDPWPKKRHFKRRLVYREFLLLFKQVLRDDGTIYFKSDNDGLYEFALEELNAINAKIIFNTNDFHNSNFNIKNHLTEYEEKFKNKGKNINFIAFKF